MENEKKLVVQHNTLIEANYKLNTVEQKIILKMLSNIEPEDKDFKVYKFYIKEFEKLLERKNKNIYSELKKATKSILGKPFTIVNYETNRELQVCWISSAEYIPNEGCIELMHDPKLKKHLLHLKKEFTAFKLENALKLKSRYAIRIYELLKQYQTIGERTFEVSELRHILAIDSKQYKIYSDFKKRVLITAQTEIKNKTDISFEFSEIKGNRAIEKIRFIIKPNKKNNVKNEEDTNKEILEIIENFKKITGGAELHIERVKELLKLKSYEEIRKYIDSWDKFNCTKDAAAFFYKAVKEGYSITNQKFVSNRKQNYSNFEQRNYDDDYYDNFFENIAKNNKEGCDKK